MLDPTSLASGGGMEDSMPDTAILGFPRHRRKIPARPIRTALTAASAAALAVVLLGAPSRAADIHLLSAAAMQSVLNVIAGDFERASGHKLIISYGTIGGISQRVDAGEPADLVIASSLSMPALVKSGKVDGASLVTICKTAIGAVVPAGTPKPAFATVEDFKQAVLAARTVIYADPARGGAAGIHIGRMIEKLGLSGQVQPKTRLAAGGDVTEVTLASGAGAFGMTQVSEIVEKPGADFVGPLPDELQNATVFVGGIPSGAKPSEATAALVAFLKSPIVVAAIKAKGMQAD
jgi:molybdate transport system substrate-binding protein